MQVETKSLLLRDYLGRVRSLLPLRQGPDILRELESSIHDRVDEMAANERRKPDDEILGRALAEMGDPETVANSYSRSLPIFDPQGLRQFRVYTAILFAVHLALIGVATTTGDVLQFGPFAVAPVGPHGFISTAAAAAHALLLDVGLMAFVFTAAGAMHRRLRSTPRALRVDATRRTAVGRMVLSIVVAVTLNVFRDRVFVVVADHVAYPMFTSWFAGVLPLIDAVLAVAVVSDALYLVLGETRLSVTVDALHGAAALACMLFLLRGDAILALPPIEQFAAFFVPVNNFLAQLGGLVVGFLALVFAVKTVRRLLRFAQL